MLRAGGLGGFQQTAGKLHWETGIQLATGSTSSGCKTPCPPRSWTPTRVHPMQHRSPPSCATGPCRRLGPASWPSRGHRLGKACHGWRIHPSPLHTLLLPARRSHHPGAAGRGCPIPGEPCQGSPLPSSRHSGRQGNPAPALRPPRRAQRPNKSRDMREVCVSPLLNKNTDSA